jgi:hypothetical protein
MHTKNSARLRVTPLLAVLLATTALPAFAANSKDKVSSTQVAQGAAASSATPSPNATINLINLLVKQGVLTAGQADALIKQANAEAAMASGVTGGSSTTVAPTPAPAPDGSVRVTYVPEVVRKKIKEEVKQEVLAQAKSENWAAPNTFPDWVSRIKVTGDVRGRYEGSFFPSGNDNSPENLNRVNYNAINTGAPYNLSKANERYWPSYNVDQDRNRYRLRARLGVDADLGEGFSSGLRIATGDSNSPVSTNQTLGRSGGNFSKYAIWLDRAFIAYQPDLDDELGLKASVGRFDNPFFATDLTWDSDIGLDGVALKGNYKLGGGVTPFITAGAFPVFNTDFNFSSTEPTKFKSNDRYLWAAQGGVDWAVNRDTGVKLGAAFYNFEGINGKLSSPCLVLSSADVCDTDIRRPSFAQKGNSYMALRQFIPVPTRDDPEGDDNQYQYFGLASEFRPLVLTGKFDYDGFKPVRVTLAGEYIKNLGFDKGKLNRIAVNNRAQDKPDGSIGDFDGGDTGYLVSLTVGSPSLKERWDWNASVAYRYLESDAVPDAFTDSDFGLGGTNLKGYTLGGNLALGRNVWAGLRWMSADNISGSPFSVDVVQFDLNARF